MTYNKVEALDLHALLYDQPNDFFKCLLLRGLAFLKDLCGPLWSLLCVKLKGILVRLTTSLPLSVHCMVYDRAVD